MCNIILTEKFSQELTMLGHEYLSYNLSIRGEGIIGQNDLVRLEFLTDQPNGLLFYTGRPVTS